MKRGQNPTALRKASRRLELIYYRGEAKMAMLQRAFGLEHTDALWAGLYFLGTAHEVLSVNRELLEAFTPPYASISFTLSTGEPGEHQDAMGALNLAGIRYDESIGPESALEGTQSPSGRVFKLSGATLNGEIYRLVFENLYGIPTLVSHRFFFTISPPLLNLEEDSNSNLSVGSHGKIMVSTYYWRGLQVVSTELTEESLERLAGKVADGRNASLLVRNR